MPGRGSARIRRRLAGGLMVALLAGCSRAKNGAPAPNSASGASLRAQAVRLLREGEPRSALEILRNHGNLSDPDDAYVTGEAAWRSGQYAEAGKAYQRVLSGRPGDLAASSRLARLAYLEARYDDARQQLDWILARSPDRAEARALRAMVRYRLGDLDGAASDARKWSELAPREAEPLRIAGAIHLQRGEVGEAIRVLKQAVELSPTQVPSRLDLAR